MHLQCWFHFHFVVFEHPKKQGLNEESFFDSTRQRVKGNGREEEEGRGNREYVHSHAGSRRDCRTVI